MELVQQAVLCKMFSCTPSQLREESNEDVILMSIAYNAMMKDNPMMLFM